MALFNQFSGTTMHNAYIILAFNITMTGLQPLIHAIFEKVCVCVCVGVWVCGCVYRTVTRPLTSLAQPFPQSPTSCVCIYRTVTSTSYIFGPTFTPPTNVAIPSLSVNFFSGKATPCSRWKNKKTYLILISPLYHWFNSELSQGSDFKELTIQRKINNNSKKNE